MSQYRFFKSVWAGLILLFLSTAALAQTRDFNVPAGDLGPALDAYIQQSGVQLIYRVEDVKDRQTPGVQGALPVDAALDQLLTNSGLVVTRDASGAMAVAVPRTESAVDPKPTGPAAGDGAAVDPADIDTGVATPGESTTSSVEMARRGGIEEIIVTGQKKEERIQDVPIAISAFSMEDLDNQKIEGGFDLLKAVPNVTFSKSNFSGYNFQIRGIGTQAVSASTDPGVAVSFNNTTLIVNRLFEQEYLDIERVEVLRGPQGTLYGRNATAGVINVISEKPKLNIWESELKGEIGNYAAQRFRGHLNIPLIDDTLAARVAYALTQRDGYGFNEASRTNDTREFGQKVRADVDGRDLWSGRITLGWEPTDDLRFNLLWERFSEDDNRVRTSKQLCHRDTGPGWEAGGMATADLLSFGYANEERKLDVSQLFNAPLSQACKPGSLYADDAFGTPNGTSLPFIGGVYASIQTGGFVSTNSNYGLGGTPYRPGGLATPDCEQKMHPSDLRFFPIDLCQADPYGGRMQSRDIRSIYTEIEPIYRADADVFELSFDWDLGDAVFSSQTVYAKDDYYATQDYNRFASFPIWENSDIACGVQALSAGPPFANIMVPNIDCSNHPDTGRGTWGPLTDRDGDGVVDQYVHGVQKPVDAAYTVDGDGFLRDADGRRVGYYSMAGVAPDGSPRGLTSGGVFCDPQLGCSNSLRAQDLSQSRSKQFNQEFRLVSSYDGPFNFSVGANYTRFETTNDYYVFINALSYLLHFFPFNGGLEDQLVLQNPNLNIAPEVGGANLAPCLTQGRSCRYLDPNPLSSINGEGHNYFRSQNPYQLTSSAIFGETYWNITDALKLTTGLRLTWDRKVFTPVASQLLLSDFRDWDTYIAGQGPLPCRQTTAAGSIIFCSLSGTAPGGRGFVAEPDIVQEWREPTGRIVLDWKPDPLFAWQDETLLYASLARGYKGGGANPPAIAEPAKTLAFDMASGGTSETFKAEYVNAFEIGAKNTLFGGGMTLNLGAFYYDYSDYQVSRILDRRAVNDNFDATIWGVELETTIAPTPELLFNAAIGYLRTRVADGEQSIDIMDRTDGGNRHYAAPEGSETSFPDGFDRWVVVQPAVTAAALCVAPEELVRAEYEHITRVGGTNVAAPWNGFCPTGTLVGGGSARSGLHGFDDNGNVISVPGQYRMAVDAPNGGAGFSKDLSGNELPNAPRFTVALGGQYTFYLPWQMDLTTRLDWYWQDDSYARIYNLEGYDNLKSWSNTNLSVWMNKADWNLKIEAYVKNVFNETPITGTFLNSEDSGLTTNVFTLDPRLIGLSITKRF